MTVDPTAAVYRGLKRAAIDFVASVPCINLKDLLLLVEADPAIVHVPATREEEGVGICAGAWIGGRRPALMMQNSGLGNSINALASLDQLYGIPLLMIISHRGGEGESISAQVPMGRLTPALLDAMEIPFSTPRPEDAEGAIARAWNTAAVEARPAAVLLDITFWRGG
ncbi:MAG: sulfopyruvate decarboxylase subunit alpha [Methanotrichaceae archaeon]|nr:sulfopyruvate decarboxylase subunit alpha [Methanotrichaceae archaeon]